MELSLFVSKEIWSIISFEHGPVSMYWWSSSIHSFINCVVWFIIWASVSALVRFHQNISYWYIDFRNNGLASIMMIMMLMERFIRVLILRYHPDGSDSEDNFGRKIMLFRWAPNIIFEPILRCLPSIFKSSIVWRLVSYSDGMVGVVYCSLSRYFCDNWASFHQEIFHRAVSIYLGYDANFHCMSKRWPRGDQIVFVF